MRSNPVVAPSPSSFSWMNLDKQWQNREVESQWASSEFYFRWNIYLEQPNGFFPKLHQSTRPMCQPHFIDQFLLLSNLFYPLWVSVTSFSHLHVLSFLYVVIVFFLFFFEWPPRQWDIIQADYFVFKPHANNGACVCALPVMTLVSCRIIVLVHALSLSGLLLCVCVCIIQFRGNHFCFD